MKRLLIGLLSFGVFSLALNVGIKSERAWAETEAVKPNSKKAVAKGTRKAKRKSEKEAEGSEARNRFEADTVIKSKYQLNGDPLEVDPD